MASAKKADKAPGDGQDEVVALLSDPRSYPETPEEVRRIDTHGAMVFLAGQQVFKIKRAVRFPYMDFSSLEKRRAAVENELAVNRHNAPDLYKGVVAVTRQRDGSLAIDGSGEPVEWAVHMARFDESRTLDRLAEADGLDAAMLIELAKQTAAAHRRAPERRQADPVRAFARIIADNSSDFAASADIFEPAQVGALERASRTRLDRVAGLLQRRAQSGFIRHCHGDLHLKNIVSICGHPVLFDAIEFDDAIATIDILYDLAFLLMDLMTRDMPDEANLVFNEYLKAAGSEAHLAGLEAMPLFLSLRAAIRAKVMAAALKHKNAAEKHKDRAAIDTYFAAAQDYLNPPPGRLLAIGGLSGTGKTTIARAIAARIGPAPGAVHLRSDVERKAMFGVGETEALPEQAYAAEVTARVYDHLRAMARRALAAGHGVVIDAMHASPDERAASAEVARDTGTAFTGVWLEAPGKVLEQRVDARSGDASDATSQVVKKQLGYDIGPMTWSRIEAGGASDTVAERVLNALE